MKAGVVCVCGAITQNAIAGRCERCATPETQRTRQRRVDEPWTRIYKHRAYRRARVALFERDAHRCRLRHRGCVGTQRLRAHHTPKPLAELWRLARGDYKRFVALACDPARMVTACEPCHAIDDAERRSLTGGASQGHATSGESASGSNFVRTGSETFFSGAR